MFDKDGMGAGYLGVRDPRYITWGLVPLGISTCRGEGHPRAFLLFKCCGTIVGPLHGDAGHELGSVPG